MFFLWKNSTLKKGKNFVKNCGFVASEFVKTCHKHVNHKGCGLFGGVLISLSYQIVFLDKDLSISYES